MPKLAPDSDEAKRIDAALKAWRQGDLALDEQSFVHIGDSAKPLSEAAAQTDEVGVLALTTEVLGLVVLTQTCDVVRSCTERPYIEVAPLMRVSKENWSSVKRGRRPSQATLKRLETECLVVDLDRTMTIEKSIVATWKRTPGCADDQETRGFALALARKRARFAFPDDFNEIANKLQSRLIEKHDKSTDEGRGLRSLHEIRVRATPSWDAESVNIHFWFVRNDSHTSFEGKSWADLLAQWLKLVTTAGRFTTIDGVVVTLQDMTAEDYVQSDPLDLDHLSTATR